MSALFIAFVLLLAVLVAALVVRFSPIGVRTRTLTGLTAWLGYARCALSSSVRSRPPELPRVTGKPCSCVTSRATRGVIASFPINIGLKGRRRTISKSDTAPAHEIARQRHAGDRADPTGI
jgi:hypothetical protein